MYSNEGALIQDVKREVLAELGEGGSTNVPHPVNHPNNSDHMVQWHRDNYDPYASNQMYQTIKESVKNEILAEAEMQQANRLAQAHGVDRALSDQRLQRMIDARYRTINNMKEDIKKELQTLRRMEAQRSGDPNIRDIAGTLAREGQRQGLSLEQVIAGLDQKTTTGMGITGRFSNMINSGQRKGFLYGVGSTILFNFLWPMIQNNMRSIAVRSMEEGMSMVDRAKTAVSGQNQQNTTTGFVNIDPGSPTQENQFHDGDNMEQ
ncbi:MAG: hypothetical protein ACOCG5_10565 [Candidatus Alkaliphilus sp. MAG34]|nr:hypothetical protein [Clostridiales bacterium]